MMAGEAGFPSAVFHILGTAVMLRILVLVGREGENPQVGTRNRWVWKLKDIFKELLY